MSYYICSMLKNYYQIVIKLICIFSCFIFGVSSLNAQFLMDAIDTSRTQNENKHISFYKKYDRFRISGYLQPQFQIIESKGAKSYNGGDFSKNTNNRFMLRRGRLRFDYGRFNDSNELVLELYFQIDGTERGLVTRDFWGRYFENKYKLFAITTGIFARPFGYELNLSSSDRESPERGRMSQILMRTERDIGAMISIEPRKKDHPLRMLKLDFGFFNGQGLPATADYDSFKDFISRLRVKPITIAENIQLSAGLSYLNGGHFQNTKYTYSTILNNNIASIKIDSNQTNVGRKSPRVYSGADMQLVFKHKHSTTELRAEYWKGTQTATATTSETPFALLTEPYYVRQFDGAYFYLLHTIQQKHQFGIKLDWYDPNTLVTGKQIGQTGSLFTEADIKYTTLGLGYTRFINENLKMIFWYEFVKNETTLLNNYTSDVLDNVFTCRFQYRF